MRNIFSYCLCFAVFCGFAVGCSERQVTPAAAEVKGNPRDVVLEDVKAISAYPDYGVVLIGCRVCQGEEAAGLFEFSRRTQAWAGCSDGSNEPHFIIKTDVPFLECNQKLLAVGAKSYRQFSVAEAIEKLKSGYISQDSYLDGTPVMVSLRWKQAGQLHEVPFQQFFSEKIVAPNGLEIVKAFTPHFVYHGSGVLNKDKIRGCLVCQQDCSGGLICNNQSPCIKPVPMLQPNWDILPPKGTLVTFVIYVLPER